jgi:hypothetical protein
LLRFRLDRASFGEGEEDHMHSWKIHAVAAAIAVAGVGIATPAAAQATRTWVSGVGDDVNPCSRTAPCKTFAGAISKTASAGEINCLDPGGFGSVTITKPITILCDHTEGGALAGGNGITVNLPADGNVMLSGLDIFGTMEGSGVMIRGLGSVIVRNSVIRRFDKGAGIDFQPTGAARLVVLGSTISANKTGIAATGAATGQVFVGDTSIVTNGAGLSASGGVKIVSLGNNIVAANGTDGAFGGSQPRK